MAVPRNRHSTARRNSKRAHSAKTLLNLLECEHCGNARLAHRVCPSCGVYGKRQIVKKG